MANLVEQLAAQARAVAQTEAVLRSACPNVDGTVLAVAEALVADRDRLRRELRRIRSLAHDDEAHRLKLAAMRCAPCIAAVSLERAG